ncbi:exporter of the RND superfamily protein-like protein [Chloroherpeton thalassium ATCC 35110]|uniref:Exporter of the RND superfamily protein-like protein n=1 Tax=Chloroherpeton thalassium (strain ATCC 35110 / GB-78) TaxID=517418 RepID=B3QSY1_CHLT3|nr:MMPL family transporter [Chloroherpeton thalassium]ACF12624.1 exporter of the RND superfamily protein-like protein [Chloroherpeton thalassium ATCC 35110]
MREKMLRKFAKMHAKNPWLWLGATLILTLLFAYFASNLRTTMRWADLLPEKDPRTIEYNEIVNEFTAASSIVVLVQGEEARIKAFADFLAPKLKTLIDSADGKPFVKRVDYKQEVDFVRNHGLMLIKSDYLKNTQDIFKNPNLQPFLTNLNNSLEKEYVGKSEAISGREKEDRAVMFLDGIDFFVRSLQQAISNECLATGNVSDAVDRILLGDPYFMSYDKKVLILNVIPTFTAVDMEKVMRGVGAVQAALDEAKKSYPDVKAGLTGMLPLSHDEMVYSEESLGYTTVIALVAIFFMLAFALRMWSAPALAILNLMIGIVWAMGMAALLVGELNIFTSMMAVILLGLGIDFSIHLISTLSEFRSLRHTIEDAMVETFLKSGKGIITGGLTTFAAFFTLIISSSRGMKEMGLVTAFGLLMILIATFMFLPSLLVLRERRLEKAFLQKKKEIKRQDVSFKQFGNFSGWLGRKYGFTLTAVVLVTFALGFYAQKITFDQNYMNMEPEHLASVALQDTVLKKFDLSMDFAMILANSPDEVRQQADAVKKRSTVAMTDDISAYLPAPDEQRARAEIIKKIKSEIVASQAKPELINQEFEDFIGELERLEMNIMEMQDLAYLGGQDKVDRKCASLVGNPNDKQAKSILASLVHLIKEKPEHAHVALDAYQAEFAPYFKSTALQMATISPIELNTLPESILDRYANASRDKFLLTVFPNQSVWADMSYLDCFTQDLQTVSTKVTGMPIVFMTLIEVIGKDGKNAVLLTLFVVFLLLWVDFQNPLFALIAMIPLTVGMIWMIGLMVIFGMELTVINVMALPMIVGIGIDDGVHVLHRWQSEGQGKLSLIYAGTGKAILLTSLTTMLAFGSLMFSVWPGFASLGNAMSVGVGACFLTTTVILPGILGLFEQRKHR